MHLTDGTRVVLAAESRLIVPAAYDSGRRTVLLEGEAYFDVSHDARHPFVVHAKGTLVHDLGTAFDVRAYSDERGLEVLVAQGRVMLRHDDTTRAAGPIVSRGELARVDGAAAVTVTHVADMETHLAWIEGRLAFDKAPLRDVAREIERWYDVDVTIASPSLSNRRVTLTLGGQTLTEVLDAITLVAPTRYERSGRHVTFFERNTP
jgi:ferric-dicitrate binding protein FerR (iron transport regulator)